MKDDDDDDGQVQRLDDVGLQHSDDDYATSVLKGGQPVLINNINHHHVMAHHPSVIYEYITRAEPQQ